MIIFDNTIIYALFILAIVYILKNKFGVIGELPGDISFTWRNINFYFPFTSGLLIHFLIQILFRR